MKKNLNVCVYGDKVILIPYMKEHVPKYHEWMKSEELRFLTASEELSLEEEFAMQNKWMTDEDKCTFIILDKEIYTETQDEIAAMIGDTNLFFNDHENVTLAEIEIMIADISKRGKGFGKEAALLMLRYGGQELNVQKFAAKIGKSNEASRNMFGKLGFVQVLVNDVFDEVTLELEVTTNWNEWLMLNTISYLQTKRKNA